MSSVRMAIAPGSRGGLSPADRGLLARVEAELALDAAFPGLPRRASGAVELLRALPGGEVLVRDALDGLPEGLRAALVPSDPRGLPAALVHHAAVLSEDALARALDASTDPRPSLDRSTAGRLDVRDALDRAVAAWLELGREGEYLGDLAARGAGVDVPAPTREGVVRALALRGIETATELARSGLSDRTEAGHAAVLVLRNVPRWVERLELTTPLHDEALSAARAGLDGLATAWLVRFRDGADDLLSREWTAAEASALLADAARTWEWLDREPELERHVVTTLPELVWPLYRKRAMSDVGALLTPIMPLAWALERRVLDARAEGRLERDLPYVAPCAQALVFWAELPREIDVALERIERAYALCPTLRNARIVLAHVLCDRAEHTLSRRDFFPAHPARADVERAASVFPDLSRLPDLRARIGARP